MVGRRGEAPLVPPYSFRSPNKTMALMTSLTRRTLLMTAAAALWCWPRGDRAALPSSPFELPSPAENAQRALARHAEVPRFFSHFIEHHPPLAYAHCPSLCETASGKIVCAWYAGSREGAKDVAVWMSDLDRTNTAADRRVADDTPVESVIDSEHRTWSPPRVVVDRETAVDDLDRYLRKVGNAVVFADAQQRLWLVYVTIALGGWSGSSLNARCSLDGGTTWQPSQRLSLSPFLNVSELVRAAPVRLESGEIGLPIYHECVGQFPEILWLRPTGDRLTVTKTRLTGGRTFLQPAIVPLEPHRAIAYLRNVSPARRIDYQETTDGGFVWSPPRHLDLPNPNSSVAALRLSSGSVLMAFNDSASSRENLTLAVSHDGIHDWKRIAVLDQQPKELFAYPYLIQATDGLIHLAYAWQMQKIRHVAFNEAWVEHRLSGENGSMEEQQP